MFQKAILAGIIALVGACVRDETVRNYGASDRIWQLVELNGNPFAETASLSFADTDRISGSGPCNSFAGTMSVPYPWFKAEALLSTKMACPALSQETLFFTSLGQATLAEVLGDTLILSNTDGLEMVFTADG